MIHIERSWPAAAAAALLFLAGGASAKTIKADAPVKKGGYTFSETFLAGGPDAPEEAQFFERLGSVAVDADAKGNVYVLDNGNYRIQVFDASGKYVRSMGREGEGPGEMKLPMFLTVNAGGFAAVYDLGSRRASVFRPDGSVRNDMIIGERVQGLELRDDGTLVVAYDTDAPVVQEAFDANGKSVWTLKVREAEPNRSERVVKMGPGLVSPTVASTGSGNLFGVIADAYSVGEISPDGTLLMDFTRPFERQKPKPPQMGKDKDGKGGGPRMIMVTETSDDGGHAEAGAGDGGEVKREIKVGDGHDEGGIDWNDLAKYMPEFTSDLRGVLCWPDGRIWAVTSKVDGEKMVSDEWDASGTYLRTFSIPDRWRWLKVGSDGKLYGVTHDDEDYPMIYRLDVAAAN